MENVENRGTGPEEITLDVSMDGGHRHVVLPNREMTVVQLRIKVSLPLQGTWWLHDTLRRCAVAS